MHPSAAPRRARGHARPRRRAAAERRSEAGGQPSREGYCSASSELPECGGRGRDVDLNELLQVLWRRRITVVLVAALTIGVAIVALRVITPVYESSATVALTPEDLT